jgi:hypothetical protein
LLMFLVFSNVLMAKLVGCCGFCLQLKARRFWLLGTSLLWNLNFLNMQLI